jgi:CubicO group peptidase (beta-lactamase class C family)
MDEAEFAARVEAADVPGAVVALARGRGPVSVFVAGVRDRKTRVPVDEQTVFQAASLSKPLFAYAVLHLSTQGGFDLDLPIVPLAAAGVSAGFADDPRLNRVTARHVLSHTSGLPHRRGDTPPRPRFEPGSAFSYSTIGYGALQAAVERTTGEPIETIIAHHVFGPLGMASSTFEPRFASRLATPHVGGEPHPGLDTPAHAGYTLRTTAADYARFVRASLDGLGLSECDAASWLEPRAPLPYDTADQGDGPPVTIDPQLGWGLGWGVEPAARSVFQWGKDVGRRAFAIGHRDLGARAVLLTNGDGGLRLVDAVVRAAMPSPGEAASWVGRITGEATAFELPRTR